MTHVILVHGMNANEKSWFGVKPALVNKGHTVDDVLLPGHDYGFATVPSQDATMADWMTFLEDRLVGDDTALIGHSMGGFVISQLAAKVPDRISRLIYVAAMLPAETDTISNLSSGTGPDDLLREYAKYGLLIAPALSPQPKKPLTEPFDPMSQFSDVRRFYVACERDQVLKLPLQQAMMGYWPVEDSILLDSDHLPQLEVPKLPGESGGKDTSPDELNAALIDYLER